MTASGRIVDMDPQALELIKIANAFESHHSAGGAAGMGSCSAGGGETAKAVDGRDGVGGGGGGIKSIALQNILKGKVGAGAEGGAAGASSSPVRASAMASAGAMAPMDPASTAPTGFAGGSGGEWTWKVRFVDVFT